jgi:hypothetical protein
MTTVAIHQPNYLPWLGYLHKTLRSDVFVFLDHVPLSQGRSYTQRVQVMGPGGPAWLTVPVRKAGRSGQPIAATALDDTSGWARKHLATLRQQYGKHAAFGEVFPLLEDLLPRPWGSLGEMNVALVTALAHGLGAPCRFVRSAELPVAGLGKSELLAAITRAVGGTVYLHGKGGAGYQELDAFAGHGVELRAQAFGHPSYPQRGRAEFVPGLSVVDCLFNVGFAETRALLEQAAGAAPAPAAA